MQSVQDSTQSFPFNIPIPESVLEPGEFFIIVQKLVIAILIGILIGLEREFSRPKSGKIFAGIRTYPLLSMLGFSSALIASFTEMWMYGIFWQLDRPKKGQLSMSFFEKIFGCQTSSMDIIDNDAAEIRVPGFD